MAEALWYASYVDGQRPTCVRLSRLPYHQQLGMAFRLALAQRAGEATVRPTFIQRTGETYWHWPIDIGSKRGPWWMLPPRTVALARRATKYAEAMAAQPEPTPAPWWALPDVPPSLRRSPRAPVDRGVKIDMHLRRLLRRAERAGWRSADREFPEWRQWTVREKKLVAAAVLRPDRTALSTAAYLRSVRADVLADRHDRTLVSMVYLPSTDAAGGRADDAPPPPPHPPRRGTLPWQLRQVANRLREGGRRHLIARELDVEIDRLDQLDWLSRVYRRRLGT